MMKNKKWLVVASLVAALAIVAVLAGSYIKRAALGYVYGYPLLIMDLSHRVMVKNDPAAQNRFKHAQSFPDHTYRQVVRPNNDTLYSLAWLDLSGEPMVISVPATDGRYYVLPLMDAWTNVFATIGSQNEGSSGGEYLIAGPAWKGEASSGIKAITSPTNRVWVIARIQVNGKSDIGNVRAMQEGLFLTPLSDYQRGVRDSGVVMPATNTLKEDPYEMLENLTGAEYFSLLSQLMSEQPPAERDSDMVSSLESIGVSAEKPRKPSDFNAIERMLLQWAVDLTFAKIKQETAKGRPAENGWKILRDTIGSYGTDYAVRAGVAMIGLGALPPQEAVYPNTTVDNQGRLLSGQYRYRVHFAAGETPPVNAFWSLTMYSEKGFMVDNPIDRYTIGDRDKLVYNDDGSLDILVQHDRPESGTDNWLPAPSGIFELTLRAYGPRAPVLNGQWKLPTVERL